MILLKLEDNKKQNSGEIRLMRKVLKMTLDSSEIEKEISSFEKKYNLILPDQYKSYITKHGYFIPHWFTYPLVPGGPYDDGVLNRLIPLMADNELSVDTYLSMRSEFMRMKVIPIGSDDLGNATCIAMDRKRYGTLWHWDHEEPDESLSLTAIKVFDFKEFMNIGEIAKKKEDAKPPDPLIMALKKEPLEYFVKRIESGELTPESKSEDGPTLLLLSISRKRNDLLEYFLKKGVSLDNLLHVAAGRGNCDAIEMLVRRGADVNQYHTVFNSTPLVAAFGPKIKQVEAAKLLLVYGADINIGSIGGASAKSIASWDGIDLDELRKQCCG